MDPYIQRRYVGASTLRTNCAIIPPMSPVASSRRESFLQSYSRRGFYDELLSDHAARWAAAPLVARLAAMTPRARGEAQAETDAAVRAMDITFALYDEAKGAGVDRAWPLDAIPRVIDAPAWREVERGLAQRLRALNQFIHDIHHDAKILKDKIVPAALVLKSPHYRPQCRGANPRHAAWANICGSDLVRDRDGTMMVLEDNLRVPSGVSYMLENRRAAQRVWPSLFQRMDIQPVENYPRELRRALAALSPRPGDEPQMALLTPGRFNSAYFEHALLAQQAGLILAEPSDMRVVDNVVYLRTVRGLSRVDVIYRRVDDWFLDPAEMNPESQLGVRGLLAAWRKGNVGIANAPGCGVADDKAVYAYVPKMIRYYLDEDAILPNVPTLLMEDEKEREHVLANMKKFVVKPANEAGGYGVVIGPRSTAKELEKAARAIRADPRGFVAQPLVALSTTPTICGGRICPRHVDLRPFTLQAAKTYCTPGGLTRVALRSGSFIVNSSQGGGSKDTWIVERSGAVKPGAKKSPRARRPRAIGGRQ